VQLAQGEMLLPDGMFERFQSVDFRLLFDVLLKEHEVFPHLLLLLAGRAIHRAENHAGGENEHAYDHEGDGGIGVADSRFLIVLLLKVGRAADRHEAEKAEHYQEHACRYEPLLGGGLSERHDPLEKVGYHRDKQCEKQCHAQRLQVAGAPRGKDSQVEQPVTQAEQDDKGVCGSHLLDAVRRLHALHFRRYQLRLLPGEGPLVLGILYAAVGQLPVPDYLVNARASLKVPFDLVQQALELVVQLVVERANVRAARCGQVSVRVGFRVNFRLLGNGCEALI